MTTKVFDLEAERGKLTMLPDRTPQTTAAGQTWAAQLGPFRDGQIFTSSFKGTGAWERHPKGDEFIQILSGTTMLDLETDTGMQAISLKTGMITVVPQNA